MRYVLLLSIFFITAAAISLSKAGETNPTPNTVGTPCSNNISNAWLDVMIVVDVSGASRLVDILKLQTILLNVFESITIGNSSAHNTRVGLDVYSTYGRPIYQFGGISDSSQLKSVLSNISYYYNPSTDIGNITNALYDAVNSFVYSSYRRKALVLFDATYPLYGASIPAQRLQNDGVSIITISDSGAHSNLSDALAGIATPGMNLSFTDMHLVENLKSALLFANCYCPGGTYQMKTVDPTSGITTAYGDCLYGYTGDTDPESAGYFCSPGVLVPVTSEEKFHFITDNVIPHQMSGAKSFTTDGVRLDGKWYWRDYDDTLIPFGTFPDTINATDGDIGYFSNYYGLNWMFLGGGSGIQGARPFVCQTRAYDADNMPQ